MKLDQNKLFPYRIFDDGSGAVRSAPRLLLLNHKPKKVLIHFGFLGVTQNLESITFKATCR